MDFEISPKLLKKLQKIKAKDKPLAQKIEKQLQLFQKDHLYPSLRIHRLSGNLKNTWSISIDRSYRMVFFLSENQAYFFKIGTHNEVYKNN